MKIHGFQKLTLLDYPGMTACTLFFAGCNFRCPFCHNALLVTDIDNSAVYDEEEVLSFLERRQGILDGVCITGGEPLMQPDLPLFIAKVKALGYKVKLDTNGSAPEKLKAMIDSGLIDYVAMDIKNCKEKYGITVGVENFDITPIEQSVKLLLEGKVDYEFRTTVVNEYHTVEDIEAISKWLKGASKYYLQNFVDSGNLIGTGMSAAPKETLELMKNYAQKNLDLVEIRGI